MVWVDTLTGLLPVLATLTEHPDNRAAAERVKRTLREVADDVRAASTTARGTGS